MSERFTAVYRLKMGRTEAAAEAADICIEQTVEYPQDLILRKDIREEIFGRVESFRTIREDLHEAEISYAVEIASGELTQLLNILFGNISLKPGIRLERFDLPAALLNGFKGPRFGRSGLRELLDAPRRPLLGTALKPMGLSPGELADLARRFALGGMDLIKDDHGLTDQPFCRFEERVKRCAEAVSNANRTTGRRTLYFPNITAPADRVFERARLAKESGAGGLVLSPGITGLDTMRLLAEDDRIGMPILSHPALQGSFTASPDHGMTHGAIYGILNRLAGADGCIFPNHGGRFTFSVEDCRDIVHGTASDMQHLRPIFPIPAGGMSLDRVPEILRFYGNDVVLLIGGDLHRHGPDLIESCRMFAKAASCSS